MFLINKVLVVQQSNLSKVSEILSQREVKLYWQCIKEGNSRPGSALMPWVRYLVTACVGAVTVYSLTSCLLFIHFPKLMQKRPRVFSVITKYFSKALTGNSIISLYTSFVNNT